MKKWLFGLLIAATITASAQELAEGPFNQLIIRSAMLINGNGAPPLGPVDVVVEQDKITEVRVVGYPGVEINEKRRPVLKPGGKEINAEGMYLLPGFVDMHGHIGGVAQGADWDYVFSLWLAHGITTVREPSGRGLEWALDLKKKAERNEIIAPRIFAYTGFGAGSKEITTPEQAREWVRENAKKGADGVKFFGAAPEIMQAALEENKKLGLGSACHHAQMSVARWNGLHS
ncbi:MAG: amidohydrolase, partial [Bacteroidetes bacterium]|nr:amidohydrolase [Bacteroidota bacterium]